jgi:hypothetical protein
MGLGWYDFHARYYNPVLGRWMTQDPRMQTANPYLYSGNSPMMYVDPDGELFWLVLAGAVIGAYLGGSAANDSFNPGKWDWNSGATWAGILGGAIQGGLTGYGLAAGLSIVGLSESASGLVNVLKTAGKSVGGVIWRGLAQGALVTNATFKAADLGFAAVGAIAGHGDNAMRILAGNFYYNPRRTVAGQLWEGISRGSWESLQQGLGSMVGNMRNAFGGVTNVDYFDGAVLVNNDTGRKGRGGFTVGNMINARDMEASIEDPYFMHEYGHIQQSKLLGPLYALFIAPMSGISGLISTDEGEAHSRRWYEKSANRHAKRYFEKHHGVDWGKIQDENRFFFPPHDTWFPTR